MFTLDASIFVRDTDPRDPEHANCHALLPTLSRSAPQLVEPLLLLVEVAGAISREHRDPLRGRVFADLIKALPTLTPQEALANLSA